MEENNGSSNLELDLEDGGEPSADSSADPFTQKQQNRLDLLRAGGAVRGFGIGGGSSVVEFLEVSMPRICGAECHMMKSVFYANILAGDVETKHFRSVPRPISMRNTTP